MTLSEFSEFIKSLCEPRVTSTHKMFFTGLKPADPFAEEYRDNPFKWHLLVGEVVAYSLMGGRHFYCKVEILEPIANFEGWKANLSEQVVEGFKTVQRLISE